MIVLYLMGNDAVARWLLIYVPVLLAVCHLHKLKDGNNKMRIRVVNSSQVEWFQQIV